MTRALLASTAAATLMVFGATAQTAPAAQNAERTELTTHELNEIAKAAVMAQRPEADAEQDRSAKTADHHADRDMDARDTADVDTSTIVIVAVEDGRFETLNALVEQSGLDETLSQEGPYTLFAPTDEAFAQLDEATLEELRNDESRLEEVLRAHVLEGLYTSDDFEEYGAEYDTIGRAVVSISVDEAGDIAFDEGVVTASDIPASNGVIHVIDRVIIPEHPDSTIDLLQDDF